MEKKVERKATKTAKKEIFKIVENNPNKTCKEITTIYLMQKKKPELEKSYKSFLNEMNKVWRYLNIMVKEAKLNFKETESGRGEIRTKKIYKVKK